jgi:hypothetical protein
MRRTRFALRCSTAVVLLMATSAFAVRPQSWSFSTQKDFSEGSFDNTVVDSYGQLSLGRKLTAIEMEHGGGGAELISAFAQTADGAIYVATSRDAKIFRIDPKTNKTTEIYKAPKKFTDITTMAADGKGNLLVALAGGAGDEGDQTARLVVLTPKGEKPASATRFENADVEYIWAIAQSDDGATYLGTGPHGKVYKLPAEGEASSILDTTAHNVTALAFDKSKNLIVGTDAKGLVIRIGTGDAKTKKPFVLLDAGKVDITGIVSDKEGSLFVTTAKTDLSGEEEAPPEEPETRSKPGASEPEPVEPAPEENKKSPHGQAFLPPGIFAAPPSEVPPELKALLKDIEKKAAEKDSHKHPPTTNKKPSVTQKSKGGGVKSSGHRASSEAAEEPADASSLYQISADGAVSTLMQEVDQNFALLLAGGDVLIGTGNESTGGKLFRYRLADESLTLLARLKEEQITTLFASSSGELFLGTANAAKAYHLESTVAKTGTFTSQVLDASHPANFGRAILQIASDPAAPADAKVTLATRSSNVRDPANAQNAPNEKFWSEWSAELDAASPDGVKIPSPAARYLQYRVTLTSSGPEATPTTPVITGIKLAYQTQNLPPKIKSVTIDAAESENAQEEDRTDHSEDADASPRLTHISWEATDPNNDTLTFRIYYRAVESASPVGDQKAVAAKTDNEIWTPLVRDLKDNTYEWNTHALPDGKYQVKVIASDRPDNPADRALESARLSATFTMDHTPPTFAGIKTTTDGNKVTITGQASDALSAVTDIRYQIDSQGDWQPAAPSDNMFDSPKEAFTIATRPLSAAGHRITIRATDAAGNSAYKAVAVTIK